MADRKPLKVLPDGGGDSTGLGEFVAADTIGVVDGGTGLATVGSNQLLTGDGTSALTSESNLTFDGTDLAIGNASPSSYMNAVHGLIIGDTSDATSEIVLATSTTGVGELNFKDTANTNQNAYLRYHHSSTNHMELGVQEGTHTYFMPGPYAVMGGTDQTNANMTIGWTINQTTNDDHILTLKSSDVNHGLTGVTETDTFFYITKRDATDGGTSFTSICENTATSNSFELRGYGATASTTKNASAVGLMKFSVASHDGSNSVTNLPADSCSHSFHGQVGGSNRTLFLIDEDGDYFYDGGDGGAFDDYADAELVRAFDHATKSDKIVRSKWDEDVRYNKQDLIDAKILGEDGDLPHEVGLVNGAQLQRLHHGAIWQNHVAVQELKEVYENRIAALEQRLLRWEA